MTSHIVENDVHEVSLALYTKYNFTTYVFSGHNIYNTNFNSDSVSPGSC